MPLETGTILQGRYRISKCLSPVNSDPVYSAFDMRSNHQVAIKEHNILSIQLTIEPEAGSDAADPLEQTPDEERARFEREANQLARLNHKSIPRIADYFVVPAQGQYLVMEFIEGHDLEEMIRDVGSYPATEAIHLAHQVCDVLNYLHSQTPPVIHRDIRPSNIRVTPLGSVALVGFGVGREALPGETTFGSPALSPGYSPPEQYGGEDVTDERSDVYALGATLFALLTGAPPPPARDRASEGNSFSELEAAVPEAVRPILQRAMELRKQDRYPSIAALQRALDTELNKAPATSRRASMSPGGVARPPEEPVSEPSKSSGQPASSVPVSPAPRGAVPPSPAANAGRPREKTSVADPQRTNAFALIVVGLMLATVAWLTMRPRSGNELPAPPPNVESSMAANDGTSNSSPGNGAGEEGPVAGSADGSDGPPAVSGDDLPGAPESTPAAIDSVVAAITTGRDSVAGDVDFTFPDPATSSNVDFDPLYPDEADTSKPSLIVPDRPRAPLPQSVQLLPPRVGETFVELEWSRSNAESFGGYEIFYTRSTNDFVVPVPIRSGGAVRSRSQMKLRVDDLLCGTTYSFRVRTMNADGNGRDSEPMSVTTRKCALTETVTVSLDGLGDFISLEDAIAADQDEPGNARRTIRLRPGRYLLNRAVELKRPITISGGGQSRNITIESIGSSCFVVSSPGVRLEHLTITATNANAVEVSGRVDVTECDIKATRVGILVQPYGHARATRCSIRGGVTGVRLNPSAEAGITSCLINGGAVGVDVNYNAAIDLIESRVLDARENGVRILGHARVVIDRCEISGSGRAGVDVDGGTVEITDTRINRSGWYGVRCLNESSVIRMRGCRFIGNFPRDVLPLCDIKQTEGFP